MSEPGFEFSAPVALSQLSMEPKSFTIEADEDARTAVAARLQLESLHQLKATMSVSCDGDPERADTGVVIDGRIMGHGSQTCVVSLQPVPFEIDATIHGLVLPGDSSELAREELTLEDDEVDILGEIENGSVDLGELAVQQLALELDPFPRAEGVEPDWHSNDGEGDESAEDNPFAALAKLKDSLK